MTEATDIQRVTRWRTRVVEKEALYFDGSFEAYERIRASFGKVSYTGQIYEENGERRGKIIVPLETGACSFPAGYYIVKDGLGLYACEEDRFYQEYEPAEEW